jgi:hypothetical protein
MVTVKSPSTTPSAMSPSATPSAKAQPEGYDWPTIRVGIAAIGIRIGSVVIASIVAIGWIAAAIGIAGIATTVAIAIGRINSPVIAAVVRIVAVPPTRSVIAPASITSTVITTTGVTSPIVSSPIADRLQWLNHIIHDRHR